MILFVLTKYTVSGKDKPINLGKAGLTLVIFFNIFLYSFLKTSDLYLGSRAQITEIFIRLTKEYIRNSTHYINCEI